MKKITNRPSLCIIPNMSFSRLQRHTYGSITFVLSDNRLNREAVCAWHAENLQIANSYDMCQSAQTDMANIFAIALNLCLLTEHRSYYMFFRLFQ